MSTGQARAEPVLTPQDVALWRRWSTMWREWARTASHARAVDRARRVLSEFLEHHAGVAHLGWSAGKDSTALAVLAAQLGARVPVLSVKDDLDFPGEVEYLTEVSSRFPMDLHIRRPGFSLQDWIRDHGLDVASELHSRASAFSRAAFYDVIAAWCREQNSTGAILGIRAAESSAREAAAAARGQIYQRRDGEWVCLPLLWWRQDDVYAFLLGNRVEPLHVYRCIRFHAERPERVRKSWWIGGTANRRGAAVWLRTYYPSLYRRLVEISGGDVQRHA